MRLVIATKLSINIKLQLHLCAFLYNISYLDCSIGNMIKITDQCYHMIFPYVIWIGGIESGGSSST